MKKNPSPRPEPIPVNVVCSLCGEAWSAHREENGEVSTLECIRLLRAKAPVPLVIYRDRWPNYYPYWTTTPGTIYCGSQSVSGGAISSTSSTSYTSYTINSTEQRTPTVVAVGAPQ